MKLKLPVVLSQRDSQWSSVLLGFNTSQPYTLGNYGCLITCLSMLVHVTPDVMNQRIKDAGGFVNGGLFVWGKSGELGLPQLYVSPKWDGPVTDFGFTKAKEYLDQGYALLAEIDFNPATVGEEMHFILVVGYDDNGFIMADPWTGTVGYMDTYGGFGRAVIQFRVYDKRLPVDTGPIQTVQLDGAKFTELVTKATALDNQKPPYDDVKRINTELYEQLAGTNSQIKTYDGIMMQLANILGVEKQPVTIVGEVEKLRTVEDSRQAVIRERDEYKAQLETMTKQYQQVETDKDGLQEALQGLTDSNKKLTDSVAQLTTNLESATSELSSCKNGRTPLAQYSARELIVNLFSRLKGGGL